jgi:hypothetical protein
MRTLVVLVLGEEPADDVPDAARDMHERALLAEGEAGRDGERQPDGLGEERAAAKITVDDETCELES